MRWLSIIKLLAVIVAVSANPSQAQRLYNYSGSLIAKVSPLALSDADIGMGAALEYRFSHIASTQLAVDYIFGGNEPEMVKVSGIRLRPEIRAYLPNSRKHRGAESHVDAYLGVELAFKYVKTNFEEWIGLNNNYASYKQFAAYNTRNVMLGSMLKFGVQGYITSARNIVFDIAVGAGPGFNNVSGTDGRKILNQNNNEDYFNPNPFSENKRNGLYALVSLDFRVGYRF